jgi:enterochelin esterase-like enzyme
VRFVIFFGWSLLAIVGCGRTVSDIGPQIGAPSPFGSCSAMKQHLLYAANIAETVERETALDELWATLQADHSLPFVIGDSAAFLYRGPAETITFTGDFNGWNPEPPHAVRLGASNVWLQEEVFPADSRLDYKVVRNGSQWQLDPANARIQRSGFGDNSELRMPDYAPSPYVARRDDVARGELAPGFLASDILGYPVNYQVYTPSGYSGLADLPALYVTDGHEYADDAMGSLVIVLDNLIAEGLIRPLMAVFIDPRVYAVNRRSEQYILNPGFVRFVAEELVPVIEAAYSTSARRGDRGILGTSLGGLNSAYFALMAGDVFERIAIQSPAFHAGDGAILDLYRQSQGLDVDFYISHGTMHDFGAHTTEFLAILDAKGYDYTLQVVNEGHSWGNWRALLDDLLIQFWPAP